MWWPYEMKIFQSYKGYEKNLEMWASMDGMKSLSRAVLSEVYLVKGSDKALSIIEHFTNNNISER